MGLSLLDLTLNPMERSETMLMKFYFYTSNYTYPQKVV